LQRYKKIPNYASFWATNIGRKIKKGRKHLELSKYVRIFAPDAQRKVDTGRWKNN
jgi:hypothetical protein